MPSAAIVPSWRRLGPLALVAFVLLMLCSSASLASDVAEVFYGRGVQAYLDEQWTRAHSYFDRSVTYGPKQPRAYYFRGLARHQLGRVAEAEADFRQGAMLEARLGRVYKIGAALQRMSGPGREALDAVRVEMLSDLPAYRNGAGLPGGDQRAANALRPRFRLPISALTSIENPAEIAQMVESERNRVKLAAFTSAPPVVVSTKSAGPEMASTQLDSAQVDSAQLDSTQSDSAGMEAPGAGVPEGAVGSMTSSELLTTIGSVVSEIMGGIAGPVRDAIPGGAGGPMGPGDFGPGGFDDGGFDGGFDDGDPFGDGGMQEDDPFGAGPPAGDEDPFGASEDEEDPFGDPFGDDPGMGSDDPFGE